MVGKPRHVCRLIFLATAVTLAAPPPSANAQDDHANGASGSTVIRSGQSIPGAIESPGDRDVFRLTATSGAEYRVETTRLANGMDSLLDLYDPRGQHVTRDDDGGDGYASKITFTATEDGTYYLLVSHYDKNAGTGTYALEAERLGAAPAAAPAPSTASTTTAPTPAGDGLTLSSVAFDPKLEATDWEAISRVTGSGTYSATLTVRRGNTRVATLISSATRTRGRTYRDSWDGMDSSGDVVPPGTYSVRLEDGSARHEQTLHIVRLGVRSVTFLGDDRVPLAYHRVAGASGGVLPLDTLGAAWTLNLSAHSAGCLDASTGRALSGAAPWQGLDAPPRTSSGSVRQRGRSLPVAYVQGSTPRVRLLLGDSASDSGSEVACGYPISGQPLRVVVSVGGSPTDASGEVTPGGQATVDLGSLPRGVGKRSLSLRLTFQVRQGGAWQDVPGFQETRHTIYTVIAKPSTTMLPDGTPWVAGLDLVSGWAGGNATSWSAVLDACVRGVNGSGLRYDVNYGAPAYTQGSVLEDPWLDLESFLDGHGNGEIVNCLDCAGLVSKLAAQAGVDSNVVIIGYNFDLNWLRGIGWQSFTHSLFGGSHGFSYHAVASGDRGRTVHDACLSVDDDSRPWSAPHTEGLPLGMPYDHYQDQLSPDLVPIQELGRAKVIR